MEEPNTAKISYRENIVAAGFSLLMTIKERGDGKLVLQRLKSFSWLDFLGIEGEACCSINMDAIWMLVHRRHGCSIHCKKWRCRLTWLGTTSVSVTWAYSISSGIVLGQLQFNGMQEEACSSMVAVNCPAKTLGRGW